MAVTLLRGTEAARRRAAIGSLNQSDLLRVTNSRAYACLDDDAAAMMRSRADPGAKPIRYSSIFTYKLRAARSRIQSPFAAATPRQFVRLFHRTAARMGFAQVGGGPGAANPSPQRCADDGFRRR